MAYLSTVYGNLCQAAQAVLANVHLGAGRACSVHEALPYLEPRLGV